MPSTLQKRLPAATDGGQRHRATDQSPSSKTRALPASAPAGGHDSSRRQSQTFAIDIVQRLRVTSDEPLTRRKIDAVKKSLGKLGLGAGDDQRGCVSDDEAGAGRVRVVQTALEVVRGSDGAATSPPAFPPPPRPHSASPLAGTPLGKQKQQDRPAKQAGVGVPEPPKRILFYHAHDPYYGFTNFSPDPVEYRGKRYPTSEHLFQSLKVSGELEELAKPWGGSQAIFFDHRPELAEHIRTCSPRPRVVFDETHRFNPEVRSDWLRVRIDMMDLVLWHKFTQNENLKRELLSTGDAELVEDSDKDAFWGIGPDGKGENQLGKALQRLRAKLRDDVSSKPSQQR